VGDWNASMGDGAVHFFSFDINFQVRERLDNRADGFGGSAYRLTLSRGTG
jgi:hypothetical protein